MNKVLDFAKKHILVIKWTIGYFFVLWLILEYIFRFNVFSYNHWWKFFHATLHGFNGFVFGALMYSAIPIYLAGVIITHKKQITLIEIPFAKKYLNT